MLPSNQLDPERVGKLIEALKSELPSLSVVERADVAINRLKAAGNGYHHQPKQAVSKALEAGGD